MKTSTLFAAALAATAAAAPLAAQTDPKMAELERKVEALAGEVERLKLGEAAEPDLKAVPGFGPAASKVYGQPAKKVSLGGYGEMNYKGYDRLKQDGTTSGQRATTDMLRAVLYAGYKFNDWIAFNSEVEFEHGSTEGGGAVSVEMAAMDFTPWGRTLGLRAGVLLVPMGLINETHEPTTFHGVNRPNVERRIIPATWGENGVGVFGEAGMFSYRSYLVTGLTAAKDGKRDGFDGTDGIREGRTGGANSKAEDAAWVSRLDVTPVPGFTAGGSFYIGEADQSVLNAPQVPLNIWELHARASWRGFEARGLYAATHIGNVGDLNTAQGHAGNKSIGTEQFGGYLEASYDALSEFSWNRGHSLSPFFRWERYDTQLQVPNGFSKDPANSRVEYTYGLTYKPVPQVVVKLDRQQMRNQAKTAVSQTNFGIGYIF